MPHQCRWGCKLSALIALLSIANRVLDGLEIERRSIAMHIHTELRVSNAHCMRVTYPALRYGLRTDLGGCKIPRIFWESMPHADPPKCFRTSRRTSYKRSVPMLCPSIGDILATPLLSMASTLQSCFLRLCFVNMIRNMQPTIQLNFVAFHLLWY